MGLIFPRGALNYLGGLLISFLRNNLEKGHFKKLFFNKGSF